MSPLGIQQHREGQGQHREGQGQHREGQGQHREGQGQHREGQSQTKLKFSPSFTAYCMHSENIYIKAMSMIGIHILDWNPTLFCPRLDSV